MSFFSTISSFRVWKRIAAETINRLAEEQQLFQRRISSLDHKFDKRKRDLHNAEPENLLSRIKLYEAKLRAQGREKTLQTMKSLLKKMVDQAREHGNKLSDMQLQVMMAQRKKEFESSERP
ncbi:uncharacterized protein BCR38DRAFT_408593 [Pseudomassariella vexata]|uniref:Uncharacterized protein n=1 Tax=Pseudomassariella vexata TaxID=1141098 RepID=A0A1Y2E024_9PEZI|nr:uncharacterized protein BCR38DRAFT_408593 [Pseudomassariella vexata]ORY64829.1 hypothetical protein BCR38DRAFT_408593 [Pseudomassariella vexata]